MPKDQLRQTLAALHAELSAEPDLDSETRDRLIQVAGEIDELLGRDGESGDEPQNSLLDRITGLARPFEESHPSLAALLGRIADGLSQLGI